MSAPMPSLTVPEVGAVVSTVTPLDVATELTFPTVSVARTDTKYVVPSNSASELLVTLVALALLVQLLMSVPPAVVPIA